MIENLTDIRALTLALRNAMGEPELASGTRNLAARTFDANTSDLAGHSVRPDVYGLEVSTNLPSDLTLVQTEIKPAPLDVLKQAIRIAIRLEFATVPPYLCALWSIIDQTHPVAKSIRAVAHEEMLHVALLCHSACNIDPVSRGIGVQN